MLKNITVLIAALSLTACASNWKIHGGPKECKSMCEEWDMELTGMVGVGDQSSSGDGATACVCEIKKAFGKSSRVGQVGATAAMGAIITSIIEEEEEE